MGVLESILLGLSVALTPSNLIYCVIGVTLGTFIGVIPGIGSLATISVLFPFTFYLDPTTGLIMLAGIWYGSTYGGSTASILLNLPGTPSNAVTCLDGYPMSKQGRAGVALFMTTLASFFGASFGIVLMMMFSLPLASVAIRFGPAEYFSLMLLGLVAASVISSGSALKGLAMVVFGILLGTVGADANTGVMRYTFGVFELMDGIKIVAIAMGMFGVTEVISSIRSVNTGTLNRNISFRSMLPTRDDMRRSWMPMMRGSSIGSFFGIMPGIGPTIGTFLAYALEKRIAREPDRFGNGAIEGIMAPETANSAGDLTSFIPTMALGIPGGVTMALMIGVLMIHGIAPGPNLISSRPELFWGLVMSFWVGNILLVILNVPLIGVWVRVLLIPYQILYPSIMVFICIGVYTLNSSLVDVLSVLAFGVFGYAMRIFQFPAAPLLLGFVLGPMMETHFRRALIISDGNFAYFIERPVSAAFLSVGILVVVWGFWSAYRARVAAPASAG